MGGAFEDEQDAAGLPSTVFVDWNFRAVSAIIAKHSSIDWKSMGMTTPFKDVEDVESIQVTFMQHVATKLDDVAVHNNAFVCAHHLAASQLFAVLGGLQNKPWVMMLAPQGYQGQKLANVRLVFRGRPRAIFLHDHVLFS